MLKHRLRKGISGLLIVALLLTLLPMQVFAVEDNEVDSDVFKNMQLYSAVNHRPISTYFNPSFENYFQTPSTLGTGGNQPLEWMLLAYTIQLSQPINLALYKLSPEYEALNENPIILAYDEDPDAQEEFLQGDLIGYLAGIRMTDNVEPDPQR